MKENSIKAVILDLGNVIARINPDRTLAGLSAFTNRDQLGKEALQSYGKTIYQYETGQISSENFLRELQNFLHQTNPDLPDEVPSPDTLKDIWNAMIVSIPSSILQTLKRIRNQYPLYLLSNTNALHVEYVEQLLPLQDRPFSQYFDQPFYSHELGLHKPDPSIYTRVCQLTGHQPKECLFIDDRKENIEGALQAGLQGYLLQNFNLETIFDQDGRFVG